MTHPRLSELKAGDIIHTHGNGACLPAGNYTVYEEEEEEDSVLYIRCAYGDHSLDGEIDSPDDDTLVNFTLVPK